MLRVSNWKQEEVDILKRYYHSKGVKGCQELGLNRSRKAIINKVYRLGINTDVGIWTVGEMEILNKYYKEGGAYLCKQKGLDKSISVITRKADSLGIFKTVNRYVDGWSEEELKLLKRVYPGGGYIGCQKRGLNRSKHAINRKVKSLGIKKENSCRVLKNSWNYEELKILNTYYPIGGSLLCIEKGIKRSKIAIRRKANIEGITVLKDKEV